MSRSTIHLEAIDPIEIYGAANKNLEALCGYFPDLKVIARGFDIILDGKESDIEQFTVKLNMLIERRKHKMNITPYDVEDTRIILGEGTEAHRKDHLAVVTVGVVEGGTRRLVRQVLFRK